MSFADSLFHRREQIGRLKDFSILLIFGIVFVALSLATPRFVTVTNLTNVLDQVALIGIIAMGMTVLLISGNFDLSVGGQVAFIGLVTVKIANSHGLAAGIVAGLGTGLACGLFNGFVVTTLRVNSLIATLGSGLIFSGLAFILAGSSPIYPTDTSFQDFAIADFLGLPAPGWVFIVVAVITGWLLHFTVGGREIYAVGENPQAARYAGVRSNRIRYFTFAYIGILCAVASLLLIGQLNVADPSAATTFPLDVIAATVLGGVSIAGGKGSVHMAVVGVFLIGMISNGFNLLNLDPNLYRVMTGSIIIAAVAFDGAVRQWLTSPGARRVVPRAGDEEATAMPMAGPAEASTSSVRPRGGSSR